MGSYVERLISILPIGLLVLIKSGLVPPKKKCQQNAKHERFSDRKEDGLNHGHRRPRICPANLLFASWHAQRASWSQCGGSGPSALVPLSFVAGGIVLFLLFALVKALHDRRSPWYQRGLIRKPLRKIGVILLHDVEHRFLGKAAMVLGK